MPETPDKISPLQINNLYYFNAHTRSDEDVKRTFIVRQEILKELMDGIGREDANSIPQHYMIIGSRGMGKSTLLRRLEIEMRTGEMKEHFIPILFPEEQYNIDRLSKFWLNSLDALADTFEEEKNETETEALDQLIKALTAITDENDLSDNAFDALKAVCARYNRRPVFLIDNIDILFDGISEEQQFKLRKNITQNGAPIFVGASTHNPDESLNYDAAFYDTFDNIYLSNLSSDEMREMLIQLARQTQQENAINEIYSKTAQLEALHSLTGGNPRVAVFMFQLIANGLSDKIFENLNVLLDLITPLYKSNFEQLSKQAQVIVDALALNWDPCDLDMLSKLSKLENNQLSSQLDRLIKAGWVERGSRYSEEKKALIVKNKNYSIRERFFNIWYIMRRASRRQRGDLKSLTCFLETFYTKEHLAIEKLRILDLIKDSPDSNKVTYGLALSQVYRRDGDGNEMENEIYGILLDKTDGDKEKIAQFLNPEDIPSDLYNEYVIQNKDWFSYAEDLINRKELTRAETFIKAVIQKDKDDEDAWIILGNIHESNLNFHEAEISYKIAIEINKNLPYASIYLGYLFIKIKRFDEVEKLLQNAIELEKDSYLAWLCLGELYKESGKNQDAENAFKNALELNETEPIIWEEYASYFNQNGNYSEAAAAYRKAIEIDNSESRYWLGLGYQLYKLNQYEEAEAAYKMAVELNPTNYSAWIFLAMLLHDNLEKYEAAENAYLNALKIKPYEYNLWTAYGLLLFDRLHKYNAAKIAFEKSINLFENNRISIYYLIYLLRDKHKDFDQAKKIFEENNLILKESNFSYSIQLALFAAYEKNWGIAKNNWLICLDSIDKELPEITWNDWYKAIAVTQKLGYGKDLLQLFDQNNVDREFRPMYEALKALEIDDKKYLLNVAEEVRKPAKEIYDYMKKYQE